MKAEFTAIIKPDSSGGYWAFCTEIPGANGQGETIEEAKESLKEAIKLIFENLRKEALKIFPGNEVIQDVVVV